MSRAHFFVRASRPYGFSKTLKEFVLSKRNSWAYRSVKLLFLFPQDLGGVLPFPIAGEADGWFPRTSPLGEDIPWLIGGYPWFAGRRRRGSCFRSVHDLRLLLNAQDRTETHH